MALREWNPSDLPADFKFLEYDFARNERITLDGNGGIAQILDNWQGRAATTANAGGRRTVGSFNGVQSAYSSGFDKNGIIVDDLTGFPSGNADRYLGFAVVPQDGLIGGYRGDGTANIYCLDSPYDPGVRFYYDNARVTSQVATDNSTAHYIEVQHASSASSLFVDGVAAGTYPVTLATTLDRFGIAGAQEDFYGVIGHTFYVVIGKRPPTQDERQLLEAWVAQYKTKRSPPSDNPYRPTANGGQGLPMVDDGSAPAELTANASVVAPSVMVTTAAIMALAAVAAVTTPLVRGTGAAVTKVSAAGSANAGRVALPTASSAAKAASGATAITTTAKAAGAGTSKAGGAASGSATAPIVQANGSAGAMQTPANASAAVQVPNPSANGSSTAPARADANAGAPITLGIGTAGTATQATGSSAVPGPSATSTGGAVVAVGGAATAPMVTGSGDASVVSIPTGASATVRVPLPYADAVAMATGAASGAAMARASAGGDIAVPIGAAGAALAPIPSAYAEVRVAIAASAVAAVRAITVTATATIVGDDADRIPGPGWAGVTEARPFNVTAERRDFHLSSNGRTQMLTFPGKYPHEVRHASIDFSPALAAGEQLVDAPTVSVRGDMTVAAQRIEGTKVLFTLSGGTADADPVQRVDAYASTSTGQVLEEVVLVSMLG
ncbi:hypothetical protein [Sphingomonas sp.]|uniref:phage fiber-tail adaptor protein n=1 Tax=Sphingomonadales TaxID=204457 RepID=UPI0035C79C75